MKNYEIIEAAVDLINRTGWTQGALARDAEGRNVAYSNVTTPLVCYCALGALLHVSAERASNDIPYISALSALHKSSPGGSLICYNDEEETTKEDVLKLMSTVAGKLRALATNTTFKD